MTGKLIVITGLDGSGTSSIAEALSARDPGSSVYRTPNSPYDVMRKVIDEQVREESQAAHYLFYLSSVVYASTQIEKLLEKGNVYCVRYLIDTVVSHRAAGLDVDLEYTTSLYSIRKPDLTIMLQLDESVRQDRITVRGKGVLDKLLDDECLRTKFHNEFSRFESDLRVVTNDGNSIEEAVEAALQHMKWDQ
ncbi:AAA family ATPase [Pseudomonas putida]|uniref:Thymidylate kinase-like domain-containing protein n=1 Tax=Pseudomonas putida TaxID=303 RepID=A0A8I1JKU6_PSEPU|nr:AAA family ATPase [Pseudomonas putida]MBI6885099.1 hypothetical protein [Pseudomonas putida]